MIRVREATDLDRSAIRELHLRAFPAEEREIVSRFAVDLLDLRRNPGTFSLVAEIDEAVVGHIALSPAATESDPAWSGFILAPLGVDPAVQRRGVGSALVENGKERLAAHGARVLFVYGDPAYYGRFGFEADLAGRYVPPYALAYPFGWQALAFDGARESEETVSISCVEALRDPALW